MQQITKKNSAAAIWSLVLGIMSFICCGIAAAVPAVICGHVARKNIKQSEGTLDGDGMALAGLIMGYLGIAMTIVIIPIYLAIGIPAFVNARDAAQQQTMEQNVYAIESAINQLAMDEDLPAGQVVQWDQFSHYLHSTDMNDYNVGNAKLNPVFIVGESVTYITPEE